MWQKSYRYTTVPNHPGDMPQGTLKEILKQADVNVNDFLRKNKELSLL